MDNAAKALEIAAGVLVGVLLLSLIAYFFSTIGKWPQAEEDNISVEQLTKFNLEYEVYEKNAMYGVDVISCFNKAISNNETYVEMDENKSFLSGTRYEDKYFVDVCVKINEVLSETIEVYYLNQERNKEEERTDFSETSETLGNFPQISDEFHFNDHHYDRSYTKFVATTPLVKNSNDLSGTGFFNGGNSGNIDGPNGNKYYGLSNNSDKIIIESLLRFSSQSPKITLRNSDSSTLVDWSTIIWTTALYDFKTKRFKCDGIEYNTSTGRVNKIYFSEL